MSRQVASLLAFVLALTACVTTEPPDASSTSSTTAVTQPGDSTTTTEPPTDTTTATTEPAETKTITVLVDDLRAVALAAPAAAFTEEAGIEIVFDVAPLDEIRVRAASEGVDIFMAPHTWRTELEEQGAVASFDLDTSAFVAAAVEAFGSGTDVVAVPFSAEALVLYRNTDLWPDAVGDLSDLIAACDEVPSCLLMPGLGAAGGFHFSAFAMAGSTDPMPDGLGSAAARPALRTFERLVTSGALRLESTIAARQAFLAGTVPLFIGGPWDLGPVEDSGIPFAVQALPSAGATPLRPPVSLLGFHLSATAPEAEAAQQFLERLATAETQAELHARDRRAPVHRQLVEDAGAPFAAFAEAVAGGYLLPAGDTGSVWAALGGAVERIRSGTPADEALAAALETLEEGGG